MAVSLQTDQQSVWDTVMELTKAAQDKNSDPVMWLIQVNSCLNSAGVTLPSTELAYLLVSHICWDNHVPITWKLLEKALTAKIAPPLLALALLSTRFNVVLPSVPLCLCFLYLFNKYYKPLFRYFVCEFVKMYIIIAHFMEALLPR